ncbi:MAG: hypothetical protein Q9164_002800 [Protoblastenia rupestris]
MVYHDALYGCVYADEGKETVCFTGLRFWGVSIPFGNTTGCGGVACIDVGKMHTAVVFGTQDGRVVVGNPMRKVLHKKQKCYQQTIFRHEWVRKRARITNDDDVTGAAEPRDGVTSEGMAEDENGGVRGISRITEGYKVQGADTDYRVFARSLITVASRGGRAGVVSTTFEEETGVSAVCWNPNLSCGGWLAVGWGSGLVRVEDVGL